MLVHVLNQRHLIQSYNMQATQRNMPANHGNVQATHGNMPATHAYNNWQVNLFDRMVSTTYHWLTHSIFLFRVCLIRNTQRTKLMSMLTKFTDYCREFWMCQDYIFSSKNRWYTTFPWIICISLKFDSSFLRMAIKYYFVTKTSFFFFI